MVSLLIKVSCGFWARVGQTKFARWGYGWLRDSLLWLGLASHHGRQNFYLGKLKSNRIRTDLAAHLRQLGFQRDYYAWIDEGEVLSLRKLDQDKYQYHLRLHNDGEVRGHYEYAPDRRPLKHLLAVHQRAREGEFEQMLDGFLG